VLYSECRNAVLGRLAAGRRFLTPETRVRLLPEQLQHGRFPAERMRMNYRATTRMRPSGTWVNEVSYDGVVIGRRHGHRYAAAIVETMTNRVVRWTNTSGPAGVGKVRVQTVEVDRDGDRVCFHCKGRGEVNVRRTGLFAEREGVVWSGANVERVTCSRCGGTGKDPS
jgi:hypothetical protein